MKSAAFVDAGAFIAFLDRSDRLHTDVVSLFADPPRRWLTSIPVVAETYGWLLHRLGEDAARTFAALLRECAELKLLEATPQHHARVLAKLDSRRGTKLTYVDASSLVWLTELDVDTVWSCDFDLSVEGATVIPGAPVP